MASHENAHPTPPPLLKQRSLLWWVSMIFAPLALAGGALAIADLSSGLIRYHGPIGYAVAFWDDRVSVHLGAIYDFLLAFLTPFARIQLTEFGKDYVTLGFILAYGNWRAIRLLETERVNLLWLAINLPFVVVTWPVGFLVLTLEAVGASIRSRTGHRLQLDLGQPLIVAITEAERQDATRVTRRLVLTLGTFALFLALWVANFLYGVVAPATSTT